jgi:predicted RNase H-like HicB family nuclease
MLTKYIQAAMVRAKYELLPDGEGFFAEVPELPGVWSGAPTLEACRDELQGAIESWIVIKLRHQDNDFPVLDGVDLNSKPAERQEVA